MPYLTIAWATGNSKLAVEISLFLHQCTLLYCDGGGLVVGDTVCTVHAWYSFRVEEEAGAFSEASCVHFVASNSKRRQLSTLKSGSIIFPIWHKDGFMAIHFFLTSRHHCYNYSWYRTDNSWHHKISRIPCNHEFEWYVWGRERFPSLAIRKQGLRICSFTFIYLGKGWESVLYNLLWICRHRKT